MEVESWELQLRLERKARHILYFVFATEMSLNVRLRVLNSRKMSSYIGRLEEL